MSRMRMVYTSSKLGRPVSDIKGFVTIDVIQPQSLLSVLEALLDCTGICVLLDIMYASAFWKARKPPPTPMKMHFVLVHGACHGAWCWYKLKPLLERSGHRVSAIDLAASGIDKRQLEELKTFRDYTKPLLEFMANSVAPEEKVVLVGHSLGGLNLALAMEAFPHKIAVAIFLSAFMPDTSHQPSYVLEQLNAKIPEGGRLDSQFISFGNPEDSLTSILFGSQFLSLLYHLSPPEDFELAMMLKRPASSFVNDLANASKFTNEGYGQVKRAYVVCKEDKVIKDNFQHWMIENGGVDEVKELKGSDHMPMLCMPQVLCDCLVEISEKFA